jgi:hypothetical protein
MVFRQYRFESPLPRSEFRQQLESMVVTGRFGIGMIHKGALYGTVSDDRFDLRTPSSGRGNVIWVIGRIDQAAENAAGILRTLVDPIQSVGYVAVAVIGIQFFISPSWLRIVVPAFLVLVTVALYLMGRAEWRVIAKGLRGQLGVTLCIPSSAPSVGSE